jgi:hypothetical protein
MAETHDKTEVTTELLILPDGTLYAHNLSAEVAEVLKQINAPTQPEAAPQAHE